ncbi:bifunctional protein-serine/threonine kinase/phosphatase [Zoogloea oleivorans]|uniref:Bifunctional protein-serine/threonine kinase/phosphatase n=1 Tax=Zoogloea oleivorans TaxID=1552750 RepID=A0A6C2D6T6_9RHOO|nr:bifunctional protein-serine/threonine kinase/phosphatase [Zoogloea oleivorans]TYC62198.1 bifunctional protein-serine/threonine kinase/phosphatase [Zoogloea oleivorans]
MSKTLRVTLGQASLAGTHATNQDFHGALLPRGHQLASKGIALALADGISSSQVSQLASQTAVRSFLEDYYATSEAWSVRRAAERVLSATNAWLHAQTMGSDGRFEKDRGYVCTFSALILKGRDLHLIHVGDSRIYRLHPQALEQLTEDHRVRLSSIESYLGRALGAGPYVEIDYRGWEAEAGEIYLLATDGAYGHLHAEDIHAALREHPADLDAAASDLVSLARRRGSDDDATLQLLRIDELPASDAPHPQLRREGLSLPPTLAPRMEFEGFTILREMQVSARSHLHLAVDNNSGQQYVIKTPSVDLSQDADYLDRFVLEEWIARRIDSPHVIKTWPSDRPRTHLFVAMEFIDGQTLAQWMRDNPHPGLDSARSIIEQLAQGLQALHRREMLHQDLRPENVMIDHQGTVKLIDLATAHVEGLAEYHRDALVSAAVPGTLQYTAPEYLLGEGGSPRSELFALAAITYQMLSGQLPYGLNAARVRTPQDLRSLRYVPLRHHRPDLPAWVDAVLAKALHPNPAKRQEVISEFIHDLKAPGAQFHQQRTTPLIERNPVLFWKCSTALLTLAVLTLLALRILEH